ncbi:unnamed protein product [Zymoseptoria tritici ST99CH_3D1]|uniref:Uncharacterized protein n=1 Tax=Zymoseptoria tritici ST99CH_1E4 TaxID=1276532 RepID=A0A2H1GJ64_ZYMTR|nr:unnamed protein product [Zymoseptoria tritici ST99CH_1E4]SMR56008.1 unnamed protein product [Zymoseptoria tritici ST99CH_3D1]
MHIVQAVLSSPQLSHKCPQKKSTIRNAANEEAERKERKRQQNRIAQRTYRQNQKERIQILETAIARNNNAHHDLTSLGLETPMTSTMPALAFSRPAAPPRIVIEELCSQRSQYPIRRRFSPGAMFGDGRSALHRAISLDNGPMTVLLLDEGADIAIQDAEGNTPLHLAAETGSDIMLNLLLERLADPGATDFLGRTALFSAVQAGNERAIEILLAAQIDIDRKDILGRAVLHVAVENGLESIVRLLLKHGANINA